MGRSGILGGVALLVVGGMVHGRGGWDDPPGGWDYMYDADAGEAAFVPYSGGDAATGLLDGSWRGGRDSCLWDGSAAGEYDGANTAGLAPGGVRLATYPGLAEDGSEATVLSLEVVGDTTTPEGTPFNFAWESPANEALYFYRGTLIPGASNTASVNKGMTLIARWRLTPDPLDVAPPPGQNWQGAGFTSDGQGSVSVVDQNNVNVSLSLTPEGTLRLMDRVDLPLAGAPTEFITTWISIIQQASTRYRVDVYVNGSETPAFSEFVDDPPTGDVYGNSPDDYFGFGLPAVGTPGAIEVDYIGYKIGHILPGEEIGAPTTLRCSLDESPDPVALELSWDNFAGAEYDAIEILRDGEVLATLEGSAETYPVTQFITGSVAYEVRATYGDEVLPSLFCQYRFCPGTNLAAGLDYDQVPPAVHITWDASPFPLDHIEIVRGTEVLTDSLAGDATEFWDTGLTPSDGEIDYEVTFVLVDGSSCGAEDTNSIAIIGTERFFADPEGGWDYVYNPDSHDPDTNAMDRYVDRKDVEGALDGTWIRTARSDYWDGSMPGVFTPPDDPEPLAPGGIEIRERPGEGIGGTAIKTLAIEDVGDPRQDGYSDPSNRKLVVAHLLETPPDVIGGALATGLSMYVRFRIMPDPRDVADPPEGIGAQGDGRGPLMLAYYDGDTTRNDSQSFSIGLLDDALEFSNGDPIAGITPGSWVSLWLTIEDVNENDSYHVSIFLNGNTVPARDDYTTGLENWEEWIYTDRTIAATAVIVGSNSTSGDGAIEIDFLKIKYGEHFPGSNEPGPAAPSNLVCRGIGSDVTLTWANQDSYDVIELREDAAVRQTLAGDATSVSLAGEPDGDHTYSLVALKDGLASISVNCTVTLPVTGGEEVFFRGEINQDGLVNIADAVSLLGYLFGGGPEPACQDAADCNDDGTLNVADAVALLGYLFGGQGELPAPVAKVCGTDPTPDGLPPCTFPACPAR